MIGKDFKPHIGIFGRRNFGKSSLINALTGQEVAIVSEIAGTTTGMGLCWCPFPRGNRIWPH